MQKLGHLTSVTSMHKTLKIRFQLFTAQPYYHCQEQLFVYTMMTKCYHIITAIRFFRDAFGTGARVGNMAKPYILA